MLAMDFLIVVVALPRIQQDLGFSPASLTWVPNAFGLAFGGLLLLGGRLGDMIGQVRAFRIGLFVFVVASLAGGLAQLPTVLIAARIAQGVGAALAAPSVLALVMVMARDEKEKARGLSLFTAVSSIGASAGLILGGVLTDSLSWRWALLINVPVGALVVVAIAHLVEETHPQPTRLDVAGGLDRDVWFDGAGLWLISAAENGWAAPGTLASFVGAAGLLLAFFRIEKRHPTPLLDLGLLRDRSRLGGLGVMALIVGVHFAMLFLLVQYLERVLGWTPLAAGLGYMPLTVTVFAVSEFAPPADREIRRTRAADRGKRYRRVEPDGLRAVGAMTATIGRTCSSRWCCTPSASHSSSRPERWRSCRVSRRSMPALPPACCRWTSRSAERSELRRSPLSMPSPQFPGASPPAFRRLSSAEDSLPLSPPSLPGSISLCRTGWGREWRRRHEAAAQVTIR